ncbi:uncharacterized protein K441DRAFT_671152 [Cenococcum geophilum 1.58]|uniref:uncharacterized protein n=1 Tax=Cenococcum geophilum 1.58 TaxID=794803 RepID=UPI000DC870E5|nr:hypothetical protein K441DRAFT_671152 [Cenococcum geophilum 1.58]
MSSKTKNGYLSSLSLSPYSHSPSSAYITALHLPPTNPVIVTASGAGLLNLPPPLSPSPTPSTTPPRRTPPFA